MLDYTIKISFTDSVARMAIDSAVVEAVDRFKDELGDHRKLVHHIAHAAAVTAMERFKAMCNSELRLIAIEHDRRALDFMLRPSPPFMVPAQGAIDETRSDSGSRPEGEDAAGG